MKTGFRPHRYGSSLVIGGFEVEVWFNQLSSISTIAINGRGLAVGNLIASVGVIRNILISGGFAFLAVHAKRESITVRYYAGIDELRKFKFNRAV